MSERSRLRLAILRVLVLSLMGTLLGRLWYLQVMAGEEYKLLAKSNNTQSVVEAAPRGRLLDDRGRALVRNRTALVVTVDGSALARQRKADSEAVLRRVSAVLGMPLDELTGRITPCGSEGAPPPPRCWNGSPFQPVPVKEVDAAVALRIQEHREDFPGVEASFQAVRLYPAKSAAAHALGYISPISEDELRQPRYDGYERTDLVGRSGLEQTYDRDLRGKSGKQVVAVNSAGQVTGVVSEEPPAPGNDLVLSLDLGVQQLVEGVLERTVARMRTVRDERADDAFFKAPSAAAVVMEAKTGYVVGMASYPTYDPGVFTGGISPRDYQALTSETSGYPLNSRATQGLFAPASTFKIVSTASAFAASQAGFSTYHACPGALKVGDRSFRNFDSASLGSITMRTALVKSCDTVYYRFAYDDYAADENRIDAKQPAAESLQKTARVFGFGTETGIDLPSESGGRIVDREFKRKRWEANRDDYCNAARRGYPDEPDAARRDFLTRLARENCEEGFRYRGGDHVNLSIGQGETVVTPLQLAVAYSALANGGTVFEPRLAKAVVGPDGTVVRKIVPPKRRDLGVDGRVLAYMREALAAVPTDGTARGAFAGFDFAKLHVAGKTGTGQVFGKQDTAWFASFAPASDPKYVVVVMVEQAGTGGAAAAPAVREIYEGIYGLGGKKAVLPGGQTPAELPKVMPDGTVQPPRMPAVAPPPSLPPATPAPTASRRRR